jgi:hypothetical protein
MSSSSEDDSRNGNPRNGNPTGSEPGGQNGIQTGLRLAGREELGQESISLHVPLGDREALLRRARESRDHPKPTVFLQDHLHLSLIKRIRKGEYFPRRLLVAAGKPTSPVSGEGGVKGNRPLEPEAVEEAKGIPEGTLSGREERSSSLQLTIRGWQRALKAAEVVNADLDRLEAQVATAGSLLRWPFDRCDPKVLVRAALREIAASVREGKSHLFSQGRGACAKAARPHTGTDPRKARLAGDRSAAGRSTADCSGEDCSEEAEESAASLETALSRPQGLSAGPPTGHSRISVPLPEEAAGRLEDRAGGEEWGPARLVRQGIGWVASLAATDPAEALAKVQKARHLRKKNLKQKGAQGASGSRPGATRQRGPSREGSSREGSNREGLCDRETSSSGRQVGSARGERRYTIELGPTRRVALKEATRSLSGSLGRPDKEPGGLGLEDVTCAAALRAAGLLEDPGTAGLTASDCQEASSQGQAAPGAENAGEEAYMEEDSLVEETSPAQSLGSHQAAGQEGGMPGPWLFEKPEGQDRSGWQVSIAITSEAGARLGRKARRYFRKPTEMARLAIRRMAQWARERPAEAFRHIQEESSLYQPPHESEEYQYAFQLYISFEMKVSVWRARRTLQKGPAAGLGRRVTCRQIYRAAARLAIESMEISAPLAE